MTQSKPISFLIGRSKECDVVLADPTVSRQHAQCIVNAANDLMLVDCDSKFGTFVRSDSGWRQITTARVQADDRIKLGQYETTIKAVMAVVAVKLRAAEPPAPPPAPPLESPAPAKKPDAPPPGRTVIERNPETGEIVTRKERG